MDELMELIAKLPVGHNLKIANKADDDGNRIIGADLFVQPGANFRSVHQVGITAKNPMSFRVLLIAMLTGYLEKLGVL